MSVSRGRVFTGALSNAGVYTLPNFTYSASVSLDSKFIYCASNGKIQILNRDISTGALTTGVVVSGASSEWFCTSPDNNHLYNCLSSERQIRAYSKNVSTGGLTFIGDYSTGSTHSTQLVEMSPDGSSVLTVNYAAAVLYVFQRNATTGVLTLASSISTVWDCRRNLFSPDGLFVYSYGYSSSMKIFQRNLSTGQLTFLANSSGAGDQKNASMTSDGLYIYVAGSGGIACYSRNPTTGLLTDIGSPTNPSLTYLTPGGNCLSSDNKTFYVSYINHGYIGRFDRNMSTGVLTYNSLFYVGQSYYPYTVSMPLDDSNLYCVISSGTSGIITCTRT